MRSELFSCEKNKKKTTVSILYYCETEPPIVRKALCTGLPLSHSTSLPRFIPTNSSALKTAAPRTTRLSAGLCLTFSLSAHILWALSLSKTCLKNVPSENLSLKIWKKLALCCEFDSIQCIEEWSFIHCSREERRVERSVPICANLVNTLCTRNWHEAVTRRLSRRDNTQHHTTKHRVIHSFLSCSTMPYVNDNVPAPLLLHMHMHCTHSTSLRACCIVSQILYMRLLLM